MIRIAISVEAFEAITATLPFGSMSFENKTNERGERLIWFLSVHAAVHNTFNVCVISHPAARFAS
jgi:hypothetical protein